MLNAPTLVLGLDGMKVDNNKPQKSVSLGDRPATGHLSFEMSCFLKEPGAAACLSVEVVGWKSQLARTISSSTR